MTKCVHCSAPIDGGYFCEDCAAQLVADARKRILAPVLL